MEFYLVRHGETKWNIERRMQGWGDSPLTDLGIQQAVDHGKLLASQQIDQLIASDLGRVRSTVEHIQTHCSVEVEHRSDLRECSMGDWEGELWDEIQYQWPEEFKAWREGDDSVSAPGGESILEVRDRVGQVIDEVVDSNPNRVAFVTHGITTRVLLELMLPMSESVKRSIRIYNDVVHRISEPRSNPQVSHWISGNYQGEGVCTLKRPRNN